MRLGECAGAKDPAGVRCRRFEAALSFAAVPMYDYRCERCSTQFEIRQSFSDEALTVCPAEVAPAGCVAPGEGPLKKVFSGVAISFKGDGFYKNDHGANAQGRSKEKETSSKDASSDSSSTNGSPSTKDAPSKGSSSDSGSDSSSGSGSNSDAGRSKADAGASPSSSATSSN